MRSKFIYPTKRNVLLGFIAAQIFPVLVLGYAESLTYLKLWLVFEFAILGALCLWQVKPISEFDEREKSIVLKWKGYLID